jgi:hypothetical protein
VFCFVFFFLFLFLVLSLSLFFFFSLFHRLPPTYNVCDVARICNGTPAAAAAAAAATLGIIVAVLDVKPIKRWDAVVSFGIPSPAITLILPVVIIVIVVVVIVVVDATVFKRRELIELGHRPVLDEKPAQRIVAEMGLLGERCLARAEFRNIAPEPPCAAPEPRDAALLARPGRIAHLCRRTQLGLELGDPGRKLLAAELGSRGIGGPGPRRPWLGLFRRRPTGGSAPLRRHRGRALGGGRAGPGSSTGRGGRWCARGLGVGCCCPGPRVRVRRLRELLLERDAPHPRLCDPLRFLLDLAAQGLEPLRRAVVAGRRGVAGRRRRARGEREAQPRVDAKVAEPRGVHAMARRCRRREHIVRVAGLGAGQVATQRAVQPLQSPQQGRGRAQLRTHPVVRTPVREGLEPVPHPREHTTRATAGGVKAILFFKQVISGQGWS